MPWNDFSSSFVKLEFLNLGSHLTVLLPLYSEYFHLRVWKGFGDWIGNVKLNLGFSIWKACLFGAGSEDQSLIVLEGPHLSKDNPSLLHGGEQCIWF